MSGPDATFQYAKLGWRGDLIAAGESRFSVDWYGGEDVATAGSDSTSFGVAAVQHVPAWQTEFYATVRWYDYEDSVDYLEGLAVFTGARLSF